MSFNQLPSETEKVLIALVQAENPTQALRGLYENLTGKERESLNCIVKELREFGYVRVCSH